MPVINEADIIEKTLQTVKKQKPYEIIVVDGGSTDNTVEIARKYAKVILHDKSEKCWRSVLMNKGAKKATGEILLFLHADTELPKHAIKEIQNVLKEEKYQGGGFSLHINSKNLWLGIIAKTTSLRSSITKIPRGDQAQFVKNSLFQKIGCYKEIPIMEDIDLMKKIRKQKKKIKIMKHCVKTSARRWEKEGIMYCTLRNWLLVIFYVFSASPEWLVKLYQRNK